MTSGKLAVFIPTLNESRNIVEAIANARQLGRVFVLDSLSTDGTQEMAHKAGATVIEHAFENYSAQKNWGLDNLEFDADWILILDADERVTPDLCQEIRVLLGKPVLADGFYINRELRFMGQVIRHGGI